jgi:MoxR-like ATPase
VPFDRFLLHVVVDYPPCVAEREILDLVMSETMENEARAMNDTETDRLVEPDAMAASADFEKAADARTSRRRAGSCLTDDSRLHCTTDRRQT